MREYSFFTHGTILKFEFGGISNSHAEGEESELFLINEKFYDNPMTPYDTYGRFSYNYYDIIITYIVARLPYSIFQTQYIFLARSLTYEMLR